MQSRSCERKWMATTWSICKFGIILPGWNSGCHSAGFCSPFESKGSLDWNTCRLNLAIHTAHHSCCSNKLANSGQFLFMFLFLVFFSISWYVQMARMITISIKFDLTYWIPSSQLELAIEFLFYLYSLYFKSFAPCTLFTHADIRFKTFLC